jgi:hypothetical protein
MPANVGMLYGIALAISAVMFLGIAATTYFTRSVVDRVLAGVGAIATGAIAYYQLFADPADADKFYYFAYIVPIYGAYRLYLWYRRRDVRRAERAADKEAVKRAEEWRSLRRF